MIQKQTEEKRHFVIVVFYSSLSILLTSKTMNHGGMTNLSYDINEHINDGKRKNETFDELSLIGYVFRCLSLMSYHLLYTHLYHLLRFVS